MYVCACTCRCSRTNAGKRVIGLRVGERDESPSNHLPHSSGRAVMLYALMESRNYAQHDAARGMRDDRGGEKHGSGRFNEATPSRIVFSRASQSASPCRVSLREVSNPLLSPFG